MEKTEFYGAEKTIERISKTDAEEERETGTIVYTVKAETLLEAEASAPPRLSHNENFSKKLVLQKRQFDSVGGGVYRVTLTYYPTESETVGDEEEEKKDPVYQLIKEECERTILLHPAYAGATTNARIVGKALIDGADPFEKVFYRANGEQVEIQKEASGSGWTESTLAAMANKVASVDKPGAALLAKIRDGVTSYKILRHKWMETVWKKSITGSTDRAGKIDTPPGPNPHIDGNWLYNGATASKTRSDRLWQIVREWIASEPGTEWDKEIYS